MKNETSVTIALVGPYRWFRGSGLTFNKSRVGGYNAQTIMRRVSPGSFPYSFFWNQVAAEMSIQRINEDHSILPNTTIKIKRFNSGTSPGDSIATALEIATEHPDVFAVVGEMFSLTTLFSAETYSQFQIPFCGSTQSDTRQLNKAIYPYYIQTLSITSFAEAVPSILKYWNVRRAVILLESPDGLCGSLKEFILRNNIQLVDVIQTRYRTVDYVIDVLIRSDARYVVACLNPDPMAAIYFELAKREAMVGSGYVWLATNVPAMNDNTMIPKYGENYRAQIKGLIVVGASLDQSVKIATTADDFSRRLQTSLRISEDVVSTIWYTTSAMFSYDCVGLLSHGLNKVLPSDSRLIASDIKKLHNFMNHSLFQQTGYTGMTGNPLILSKNGDAVRSMTVYQFDEFMSVFTIGQVDSDSLKFSYLKNKLPAFHDNTSVPPPDGPELLPDLITFAEHRGKMLLILAGIGICLSCLFFAMVIRFHNTKTLTSASPLFLGVMGLGCSLLYASMLFYMETPGVLQLKGRLWIQSTAITLIVGSLFLKNTRIWVIYNYKRKFSKLELSDKIWMIPMAILFSLQQLIAALWFRFSRFILVKRVSYKHTIQWSCMIKKGDSLWSSYLFYALHVVLVASLFALAFKSSAIGRKHSEFTLISSYSGILCVLAFAVTEIVMTHQSPSNSQFQQGIIAWLCATYPLTLQLIPRGIELYQHEVTKGKTRQKLGPTKLSKQEKNPKKSPIKCREYYITFKRSLVFQKWKKGFLSIISIDNFRYLLLYDKQTAQAINITTGSFFIRNDTLCLNDAEFFVRISIIGGGMESVVLDFHDLDDARQFQQEIGM